MCQLDQLISRNVVARQLLVLPPPDTGRCYLSLLSNLRTVVGEERSKPLVSGHQGGRARKQPPDSRPAQTGACQTQTPTVSVGQFGCHNRPSTPSFSITTSAEERVSIHLPQSTSS
uniref:Uncharacterized protein n=1 Tax=Plectus sambesii TaxID=2011161 RepID=A0A914UQI5_9BILA